MDDTPTPTVALAAPADVMVAVTLARMEGKLDRMSDRLADLARDHIDHEARIRAMETKAVVTPRMLVTGVAVATAIASALPILNSITIH